jgi:ATPase subunit of ABC transporter with duplicated ATPase domains
MKCPSATSAGSYRRDREGQTAVEWLHQFDPTRRGGNPRSARSDAVSGEEGLKPTDALGGETARLLFCCIMLQKPNVLLLDEPTNHPISSPSTR